ncbi:regulator of microtubule dynamics protein 1-like isoform X1 [Amphiura filiformis]|uniref:regulator of microtubule dynamics protein 1-like isoform X1 n=1 Tax=Amphiura filiformis TaxID=82378 RepID=UPI003B214DB4
MSTPSNIQMKHVLPALGVGLIVGAGSAMIVHHLRAGRDDRREKIEKLLASIDELKKEWKEFKERFDSGTPPAPEQGATIHRTNSGFISIHASSDDESEWFEEAFDELSSGNSTYTTTSSGKVEIDLSTLSKAWLYDRLISPPEALLKDEKASVDLIDEPIPEVKDFLTRIDNLLKGSEEKQEEALENLINKKDQYSENVRFMWRLAKAHSVVAEVMAKRGDDAKKKKLVYEGVSFGEQACMLDDNSADAHKWFALLTGAKLLYEPNAEKIKLSYVYKDHMVKAIEMRPTEPFLYNFYGRYIYEVSMMSWLERKAATALFGAPPTGTIDEALEMFLKGEELEPGFYNVNSLYIAKCYIQKRDYGQVKEWLEKAIATPGDTAEEINSREEAENLLRKYR